MCHLTWGGATAVWTGASGAAGSAGPQVGRLDLTRMLGQGYQVTRFTPC
jgi:hypothetical protein